MHMMLPKMREHWYDGVSGGWRAVRLDNCNEGL
jgi:hypothetical protein